MEAFVLRVLEFIYILNESVKIINGTFCTLGVSTGVTAVFGFIADKKKQIKASRAMYAFTILFGVIFVSLIGLSYYVESEYTRVPDVVDEKLREAREYIRDAGLKHSLDETGTDDSIVIKINPAAGTFLKQGESVTLTIEGGETAENGIETLWNSYSEYEQVNVQLSIYEVACMLDDKQIGYPITSLTAASIYLYESDTNSYVRDYLVDGNQVTFENIPAGIYFWIYVELDGYEKYSERIQVSASKAVGDNKTISQLIFLQGRDKSNTSVKDVQIQNNSDYDLEDLEIAFRLIGDDILHDGYSCDSHGVVDCSITYYSNMKIEVIIQNYDSDDSICSCIVELETLEEGDTYTAAWVRMNQDGTCEAIDSPYR